MDSSLCSLRGHIPPSRPCDSRGSVLLAGVPSLLLLGGLAWQKRDLPPCEGHLSSLFLLLLLATPPLSPVPPPLEAALQKAMLLRTLGPRFGVEPKFTLVFPRNVDFAIKSWSSCDTRGLGGKSRAGHI